MKITRFLFLATIFCVTFEKVHWNVAGAVSLADVLADRLPRQLRGRPHRARRRPRCRGRRSSRPASSLAFLVVYLVGYFNIDTAVAAAQYGKGMMKFAIHFLFLIVGVAYLARASRTFYWQTLGVLHGRHGRQRRLRRPAAARCARSGSNLDQALLSPITGGASSINIYGAVDGANVYRPNALTGDPNHLGVMLIIPLLALLPVYLRLERGHRLEGAARRHARLPAHRRARRRSRAAGCSD